MLKTINVIQLFEISRLNGFMTVRSAILICEIDNDCAGFTYKGPIWDLESQYKIYFFK